LKNLRSFPRTKQHQCPKKYQNYRQKDQIMIQKGVKKKVFRSKSQSSLSFWTTQVFHLFPGIKNLRTKKTWNTQTRDSTWNMKNQKHLKIVLENLRQSKRKKSLFFLVKAALSNIGSFKKRCIQTYEEIH